MSINRNKEIKEARRNGCTYEAPHRLCTCADQNLVANPKGVQQVTSTWAGQEMLKAEAVMSRFDIAVLDIKENNLRTVTASSDLRRVACEAGGAEGGWRMVCST